MRAGVGGTEQAAGAAVAVVIDGHFDVAGCAAFDLYLAEGAVSFRGKLVEEEVVGVLVAGCGGIVGAYQLLKCPA